MKIFAYVPETIDTTVTDRKGVSVPFRTELTVAAAADIDASLEAMKASISEWTLGAVALDVKTVRVKEPVRKVVSVAGGIIPHPIEFPYPDRSVLERRDVDGLFIYSYLGPAVTLKGLALVSAASDARVPRAMISFGSGKPDLFVGRVELTALWMLLETRLHEIQRWPSWLVPAHDVAGEPAVIRRRLERIFGDHVTPRMWRALQAPKLVPSPWNRTVVTRWNVAPAIRWSGPRGAGLAANRERARAPSMPEGTRELAAEDGVLDLSASCVGDSRACVTHAETWLHVAHPVSARLAFGSDDGLEVFVDGVSVHVAPDVGRWTPASELVDVELSAGWHRVVATVENVVSEWQLSMEVETRDGLPLDGVEIAPRRP